MGFDWVADDLAVGGRIDPAGVADLGAIHGIGAVIDVRSEGRDDPAALAAAGIAFLHLPTDDHLPLAPRPLALGIRWAGRARRQGRRVLVHCEHGIGRSAMLAFAILVDRGGRPLAVLEAMKTARWQVSPSPAQIDGILRWLQARPEAGTGWAVPRFSEMASIAYRHLSAPSA